MKSLMTALLLLAWVSLSGAGLASEGESKMQRLKNPVREVAVILTPEGAYPSSIFAYKGEKVKFYLSATTKRPSCFMLPRHDIFVAVPPGKVRSASFFLEHTGELDFHCPTGNIKGSLSVYEHPREARERRRRELASEQQKSEGPKIWMPRDDMEKLYND